MNRRFFPVALALALLPAPRAVAQTPPPFIGGPVTAFDVEVSIINSGELLDAQAVVSNDRRYVTINARADNSTLLALKQFQIAAAVAGTGFVGGVNPTGQATVPAARNLPSEVDRSDRAAVSILNRHGVFLLTPLK